MKRLLKFICNKYKLILHKIDEEDHSYGAGEDIFLGVYKDQELKLISLFHELGHRLVSQDLVREWKYNTLLIELECWRLGLLEARELGILFSDKAIEWGYKQAMTYVGHDERECTGWKESHGIHLWINNKNGWR